MSWCVHDGQLWVGLQVDGTGLVSAEYHFDEEELVEMLEALRKDTEESQT